MFESRMGDVHRKVYNLSPCDVSEKFSVCLLRGVLILIMSPGGQFGGCEIPPSDPDFT